MFVGVCVGAAIKVAACLRRRRLLGTETAAGRQSMTKEQK